MSPMKGLFEGLGAGLVIMAIAFALEFCDRPDKSVGPGQWFGCCPQSTEKPPAEKE